MNTHNQKAVYPALNALSWHELRETVYHEAKLPLSVHIPLNWPGSTRQVYCDCAMNAYVMDSPALNTSIAADRLRVGLQRLMMFNFAFGEPAFVPDFRQVRLNRPYQGLPIIQAEFSAWNIIYTCDYLVDTAGILHLHMTVTNDAPNEQMACVRIHPCIPLETKVFDYHYRTFEWDASHWTNDENFVFDNGKFYTAEGEIGSCCADGFEITWENQKDFRGQNPNQLFRWGEPYIVTPRCALETVTHTLRVATKLASKEAKSFECTLKTDSLPHPAHTVVSGFDATLADTLAAWHRLQDNKAVVKLDSQYENDVFNALVTTNLQLLLDDAKGYRPCQGGSSERFYVWVWEAMCALRPMLRLGYFTEVRRAIDFIFSFQDGGCPPTGKFSSTAGAIGTSGPKWANTTGAALILAADYLDYSKDIEFHKMYLNKLLRAGRWIINEIRATRVPGNLNYGIMPEACASDGDFGQLVFTDCWLLAGLMRLTHLLKQLNHPDFAEFNREMMAYKHDFDAVLDRIATPDGFLNRSFGDNSHVCNEFRFTDTCLDCCACGASHVTEPRMTKFLEYMENHAFCGLFCSLVTPGIYYIGNNELTIMKMYLEQHEWKKAWTAAHVFRRFALTPDAWLTQERYSENDVGFTAWQPNGSNNGRLIEAELCRLWFEVPDAVILYGGFSPDERETAPGFKGVFTAFGATNLSINGNVVSIHTTAPMPAGLRLVTPWSERLLSQETRDCSL